jgi:chromosome segregation ATPase
MQGDKDGGIATQIRDLQQKINTLMGQIEPAQRALVDLQKARDDAQKEFGELQKLHAQIAAGSGEALKSREVARAALDQANAFRSQLDTQFKDLKENIEAVKQGTDKAGAPVTNAENNLAQARVEQTTQEAKLKAAQEAIKTADADLRTTLDELGKLGKRIQEAQALVVKQEPDLKAMVATGEVRKIAKATIDFEAAIEELTKAIDPQTEKDLLGQIDSRRNAVRVAPQGVKDAEEDLEKTRKAVAEAQAQVTSAKKQRDETLNALYTAPKAPALPAI